MPKTQTKTKTPTKSRAKTSKVFKLTVMVDTHIPLTRSAARAWALAAFDPYGPLSPIFKSARVTNADIP